VKVVHRDGPWVPCITNGVVESAAVSINVTGEEAKHCSNETQHLPLADCDEIVQPGGIYDGFILFYFFTAKCMGGKD
jgi:hypothetical protein